MKSALFACPVFFIAASAFASEGYTGFYSFNPMESPADVGLSGATLARFTVSGVRVGNPAALPFQERSLGLGAGLPSATRLSSGEKELRQAAGAGANFRTATSLGFLGVGAGVSNAEILSSTATIGQSRLAYSGRDFEIKPGLGLRIFDELSIGAAPIFGFGSEKVMQERPSLRIEEHSYSGTVWQLGLLFSESWFRAAATWQNDVAYKTSKKIVPFEGAALGSPYKPAKLAIGFGFSLPPAFHGAVFPLKSELLLQLDTFYFPRIASGDKVYRPGSRVYNPQFSLYSPYEPGEEKREQELNTTTATVPRVGLETKVIAAGPFRMTVNAGGYLASAYAVGDKELAHYTGGVALSLWGVRAEAAVDSAPGYRHVQFGLGAAYLR